MVTYVFSSCMVGIMPIHLVSFLQYPFLLHFPFPMSILLVSIVILMLTAVYTHVHMSDILNHVTTYLHTYINMPAGQTLACKYPYSREIDEIHDYTLLFHHFLPNESKLQLINCQSAQPMAYSVRLVLGYFHALCIYCSMQVYLIQYM